MIRWRGTTGTLVVDAGVPAIAKIKKGHPQAARRDTQLSLFSGNTILGQLERPDHTTLVEILDHLGHFPAPKGYSTTPAREDRHVLFAIHSPGHWRSNNPRTGIELVEFFAGLRIKGFQVAFRGSCEHQVSRSGHYATPKRGRVLVAPDFLTSFRIHGPEHADIVFIRGLDGEASTQESRALLIGNWLVPDVHRPLVRRHVEELGLRVVGHRHPVLAAQEGGLGHYRFTLASFRVRGIARATVLGKDRPAGFRIQAFSPGDLVDKREAANEITVLAVKHVEEAVTVSSSRRFDGLAVFLKIKRDQLVYAIVIPAVMGRGLEVPLDAAIIRINGQA